MTWENVTQSGCESLNSLATFSRQQEGEVYVMGVWGHP